MSISRARNCGNYRRSGRRNQRINDPANAAGVRAVVHLVRLERDHLVGPPLDRLPRAAGDVAFDGVGPVRRVLLRQVLRHRHRSLVGEQAQQVRRRAIFAVHAEGEVADLLAPDALRPGLALVVILEPLDVVVVPGPRVRQFGVGEMLIGVDEVVCGDGHAVAPLGAVTDVELDIGCVVGHLPGIGQGRHDFLVFVAADERLGAPVEAGAAVVDVARRIQMDWVRGGLVQVHGLLPGCGVQRKYTAPGGRDAGLGGGGYDLLDLDRFLDDLGHLLLDLDLLFDDDRLFDDLGCGWRSAGCGCGADGGRAAQLDKITTRKLLEIHAVFLLERRVHRTCMEWSTSPDQVHLLTTASLLPEMHGCCAVVSPA